MQGWLQIAMAWSLGAYDTHGYEYRMGCRVEYQQLIVSHEISSGPEHAARVARMHCASVVTSSASSIASNICCHLFAFPPLWVLVCEMD